MAVHPVAFESVVWVSAMSTWGFPLAFLSWYLLLVAVARPRLGWWRVASVVAFIAALGFRETAGLVIVAMFGTVWATTGRLRETFAAIWPHLVVILVGISTSWYAVRDNPGYGSASNAWPAQTWGQLERLLGIVTEIGAGGTLRTIVATVCLVTPLIALRLRAGLVAALAFGLLATAAGSSFVADGDQARYLYVSSAMFVLLVAAVLNRSLVGRRRSVTMAVALGCLVGIGWWSVTLRRDVLAWVADGPETYAEFVDQVEREIGDVPPRGQLLVANTPLALALFDGLYIDAIAGTSGRC